MKIDDINIKNNINNLLEKDYQYLAKIVFETDNYIVGICNDIRNDVSVAFAYNINKCNLYFMRFIDIRIIINSYKMCKDEYNQYISHYQIDHDVGNKIIENAKHFKRYEKHSNYSIIFNKKNSKMLEQAILEINKRHFRNVVCNRIFGEQDDKILTLCEETQGGIKYDLIGIVTLTRYYVADIVFYKVPEFLHNLDYCFFDKEITDFCNNNDKFNTLRMLQ